MKIGEIIEYKGYTIKRTRQLIPYYIKDTGLFFNTLNQAKRFVDNMGKNVVSTHMF